MANSTVGKLGPPQRFFELTSRVIPAGSALAARLFARAHAIGALPLLSRTRLRAALEEFREVLERTGLRGMGGKSDTYLFFEIRALLGRGGALDMKDRAKFLEQYAGREDYALGKVLEMFLSELDELQQLLRQGAESHRLVLNDAIRKGQGVVDGLGQPVGKIPLFLPPVPITNIRRIIMAQGAFQRVEFFDHGFASRSRGGDYWSLGSAQEYKTPGVADDISAQVGLREPRIGESELIEFDWQPSTGAPRGEAVEPRQLISLPGSMVAVGVTVRDSRASLVDIDRSGLKKILEESTRYAVVGAGNRQRYQVVIGIPLSNFRALIRAAMKP